MCRLFGITSDEPLSPMVALEALDVMKEGHDGGLFMTDLGDELEPFKGYPILSGIFTQEGIRKLDQYMMEFGFLTKHKFSIRTNKNPPRGTPKRDVYLIPERT